MANVRMLKKDIDYLVEEVLSDCYLTIYFHPKKKEEVLNIMQEAVDLRNVLFQKVNNPAEKKNRSLVRKHYAQIRREMFGGVDALFEKLSALCK